MKMTYLSILFLALFILSCSGPRNTIHKNAVDPNYVSQFSKFKKVPMHISKDLDSFVKDFKNIQDSAYVKSIAATGNIAAKVLINQKGKVAHIYFYKELDKKLNNIIRTNLEKSKFKRILSSGRFIDYAIIVTYRFDKGEILCPLINGVVYHKTNNCKELHEKKTMEFFAVSKKPKIITKPAPYYPIGEKKAGIQGVVVVTVIIDENGDVEYAQIFMTLSYGTDHAALDSAMKLKFEPAYNDGEPVKVKMNIPYRFKLK